MILRVLSIAEAEATEAACWYDDQSMGLGELFLAEYAAASDSLVSRTSVVSEAGSIAT